jgi:hypothetical protein
MLLTARAWCRTSRLHSQHANKITKLIRGMYYRSVSTVSRIRAGRCGVRIPAEARNVFLLQVVPASALCLVLNRYGVHSRRIQTPRRDNDDTCPPSAEVNNEWRYTYSPPTTSILCFPLSVSFHQCFILNFIYTLLLPGQTDEARKHSIKTILFQKSRSI